MIGSNNPTVKSVSARFRRIPRELCTGHAEIENVWTKTNDEGAVTKTIVYVDANPAHILWEIFCGNNDWGMGANRSAMDFDSFHEASIALWKESFGLSIKWTKQSTIEAFAQDILDHISGMIFFNPMTGKTHLKLIRDDYDPDNLEVIGPDTAKLRKFQRKLWGETVNEIQIEWTDPKTEETQTLVYQDLANIAMQGQVVSQTNNYYGIRNVEIAAKVGKRDLIAASLPLATAEITLHRRSTDLLPGDVVKLNYPRYGIDSVIMRVTEVDYGKYESSKITVQLLEDVYGLAFSKYITVTTPPQSPTGGVNDDDDAVTILERYETILSRGLTAPLTFLQTRGLSISDDDYPNIVNMLLVVPNDTQTDMISYIMLEDHLDGDGNRSGTWASRGEKSLTGSIIASDLSFESESVISIPQEYIPGRIGPKVGAFAIVTDKDASGTWDSSFCQEHVYYRYRGFLFVGDPTNDDDIRLSSYKLNIYNNRETEIIYFSADLGDGKWRVKRGMFDTVPRAISSPRLFFINDAWNSYDSTEDAIDSWTMYKITPVVGGPDLSGGGLEEGVFSQARPYMPFRPANVSVNGEPLNLDMTLHHNPRNWVLDTRWSNRNRWLEDTSPRGWSDGDIPPEDGQTTRIAIYGRESLESNDLRAAYRNAHDGETPPMPLVYGDFYRMRVIRGLTGTSHEIAVSETGHHDRLLVRLLSYRDGLESLQGHAVTVDLYPKGFGSDWGYFYGGWPENCTIGEKTYDYWNDEYDLQWEE